MDWSKAKTVLIIAFAALNVFLGIQLFQSWSEQARMSDIAETSKQELEQLLQEKKITLQAKLPQEIPAVSFLEAEITPLGDEWKQNADGSYNMVITHPQQDLEVLLEQKIPTFDNYKLVQDTPSQKTYYQYWNGHPLFDGQLKVNLKNNHASSLQMTHFSIKNSETGLPSVSARTALISLIESELLEKETTITDCQLGYHGHSYEAEVRVLAPVWRFTADGKTYYVNALTGGVRSVTTR